MPLPATQEYKHTLFDPKTTHVVPLGQPDDPHGCPSPVIGVGLQLVGDISAG